MMMTDFVDADGDDDVLYDCVSSKCHEPLPITYRYPRVSNLCILKIKNLPNYQKKMTRGDHLVMILLAHAHERNIWIISSSQGNGDHIVFNSGNATAEPVTGLYKQHPLHELGAKS